MEEMGTIQDDKTLTSSVLYTGWEANMIMGCLCDDGFEGYDCSKRKCPTGDDPHTTGQVDEVQTLSCTCTATCSGSFTLKFRDKVTADIPWDATPALVKMELEQLTSVAQVAVAVSASSTGAVCDADGATTAITFTHNPGNVPLLVADSALMATTGATATLTVADTTTGTKDDLECSNRGQCNVLTGSCECFAGFSASDGGGAAGTKGDCGYKSAEPSLCGGDDTSTAGTTTTVQSIYSTAYLTTPPLQVLPQQYSLSIAQLISRHLYCRSGGMLRTRHL
jgi:hypothetical protein